MSEFAALPQHMAALERANETRFRRGALRKEIHALDCEAGRHAVAAILDLPPADLEVLASLPVVEMLTWVRRMAYTNAARFVTVVGASEWKTIGQLTPRQRELLAALLRAGHEGLRAAEETRSIEEWAAGRNRSAA